MEGRTPFKSAISSPGYRMMIGARLFAKITCVLAACAVGIVRVTVDVAISATRVEEDIQRCFTIRTGKTVETSQISQRPMPQSRKRNQWLQMPYRSIRRRRRQKSHQWLSQFGYRIQSHQIKVAWFTLCLIRNRTHRSY